MLKKLPVEIINLSELARNSKPRTWLSEKSSFFTMARETFSPRKACQRGQNPITPTEVCKHYSLNNPYYFGL